MKISPEQGIPPPEIPAAPPRSAPPGRAPAEKREAKRNLHSSMLPHDFNRRCTIQGAALNSWNNVWRLPKESHTMSRAAAEAAAIYLGRSRHPVGGKASNTSSRVMRR